MTKTFKNKNFTKRDYECMNFVFCRAASPPDANWVETTEKIPANMMLLRVEWKNSTEVAYHGFP
jgi:hypothetical protein